MGDKPKDVSADAGGGKDVPAAVTPPDRITAAVELIERYGGIDGEHHKQWLLAQVARVLLGDRYDEWTLLRTLGPDGEPDYYSPWDEGIPP